MASKLEKARQLSALKKYILGRQWELGWFGGRLYRYKGRYFRIPTHVKEQLHAIDAYLAAAQDKDVEHEDIKKYTQAMRRAAKCTFKSEHYCSRRFASTRKYYTQFVQEKALKNLRTLEARCAIKLKQIQAKLIEIKWSFPTVSLAAAITFKQTNYYVPWFVKQQLDEIEMANKGFQSWSQCLRKVREINRQEQSSFCFWRLYSAEKNVQYHEYQQLMQEDDNEHNCYWMTA